MNITSELIGFTANPGDILLSFHFVNMLLKCCICVCSPCDNIRKYYYLIVPRYLGLLQFPASHLFIKISLCVPLALFDISFISTALISIIYFMQVFFIPSTRASSSCSF